MRIAGRALVVALLFVVLVSTQLVGLQRKVLVVDRFGRGDYSSISEAVRAAGPGQRVVVRSGVYEENLVIDRPIELLGLGRPVIAVRSGVAVNVSANSVALAGFRIVNAGNASAGVVLWNASGFTLLGLTVEGFRSANIYIHSSSGGRVIGCASSGSLNGINIYRSGGVELRNNTFTGNAYGVYVRESRGGVLRGNRIEGNLFNFVVLGTRVEHFVHDVDESNTVNGRPVVYMVGVRGANVTGGVGYLALVNCVNVTVRGVRIEGNGEGAIVVNSNFSLITDSEFAGNEYGLRVMRSNGNMIANTRFGGNLVGLDMVFSTANIVANCTFEGNRDGLLLRSSLNNIIVANLFRDNRANSVVLVNSAANRVEANDMRGCGAHCVYLINSRGNVVRGNSMSGAGVSAVGGAGEGNIIYFNLVRG